MMQVIGVPNVIDAGADTRRITLIVPSCAYKVTHTRMHPALLRFIAVYSYIDIFRSARGGKVKPDSVVLRDTGCPASKRRAVN